MVADPMAVPGFQVFFTIPEDVAVELDDNDPKVAVHFKSYKLSLTGSLFLSLAKAVRSKVSPMRMVFGMELVISMDSGGLADSF